MQEDAGGGSPTCLTGEGAVPSEAQGTAVSQCVNEASQRPQQRYQGKPGRTVTLQTLWDESQGHLSKRRDSAHAWAGRRSREDGDAPRADVQPDPLTLTFPWEWEGARAAHPARRAAAPHHLVPKRPHQSCRHGGRVARDWGCRRKATRLRVLRPLCGCRQKEDIRPPPHATRKMDSKQTED